ncbi:hypothetical protein NHH03_14990 [Stieleria sp. TO1_6]|nr:hypothetical protein [Stieleria tagensis]
MATPTISAAPQIAAFPQRCHPVTVAAGSNVERVWAASERCVVATGRSLLGCGVLGCGGGEGVCRPVDSILLRLLLVRSIASGVYGTRSEQNAESIAETFSCMTKTKPQVH